MLVLQFDVVTCRVGEVTHLFFREGTCLKTWAADIEKSADEFLARRDQRPGTNHDIALDDSIVKHQRTNADEHTIGNRAAMQRDAVSYRHIVADCGSTATGVEWSIVGGVYDRSVLYVGSVANPDLQQIPSYNSTGPNRRIVTNDYIAANHGRGIDEDAFAELWFRSFVISD